MRPEAPRDLVDRAGRWEELSRWERAEVGRALRRLGWTYGEIRRVIPVPKGTLAGWCSGIRLPEEQVVAIKARTKSQKGVPRDTQRRRRREVSRIREEAQQFARSHLDDVFWVTGTSLYWAEGSKSQRRLVMANTDPHVLRIFIAWTRAYHDRNAEFVLALHLHEGNDERAARAHWMDVLNLHGADFYKTFIKTFIKPKGTGHRKNHLPWGICRVQMRRSADPWVRTMSWIGILAAALDPD